MKENILQKHSLAFALRTIKLFKHLQTDKKEFVLSKQLLRSGTAVGALAYEADHAESKADFIHKMAIAQKEAGETGYWIELLFLSGYIKRNEYESINKDCMELRRILASIILTAKRNNNRRK